MDISNTVSAVAPVEGFGSPMRGLYPSQQPPVASPELVGKAAVPGTAARAAPPIPSTPQSAVGAGETP